MIIVDEAYANAQPERKRGQRKNSLWTPEAREFAKLVQQQDEPDDRIPLDRVIPSLSEAPQSPTPRGGSNEDAHAYINRIRAEEEAPAPAVEPVMLPHVCVRCMSHACTCARAKTQVCAPCEDCGGCTAEQVPQDRAAVPSLPTAGIVPTPQEVTRELMPDHLPEQEQDVDIDMQPPIEPSPREAAHLAENQTPLPIDGEGVFVPDEDVEQDMVFDMPPLKSTPVEMVPRGTVDELREQFAAAQASAEKWEKAYKSLEAAHAGIDARYAELVPLVEKLTREKAAAEAERDDALALVEDYRRTVEAQAGRIATTTHRKPPEVIDAVGYEVSDPVETCVTCGKENPEVNYGGVWGCQKCEDRAIAGDAQYLEDSGAFNGCDVTLAPGEYVEELDGPALDVPGILIQELGEANQKLNRDVNLNKFVEDIANA